MTANPGGKGHMDGKSLFEKVRLMLEEQETSTVSGKALRPTPDQWLDTWRRLTQLTKGIEKADPRFHQTCEFLERCDRAFESDDWAAFQRAAGRVTNIMSHQP